MVLRHAADHVPFLLSPDFQLPFFPLTTSLSLSLSLSLSSLPSPDHTLIKTY